jgi:glycerophosphoryl diester phosphodiesterase
VKLILAFFAVALLATACILPGATRPVSWGPPGAGPIVIGHRGFSGRAPEHTFASYDRAIAAGAAYIEQDLQLTADGVLVVLHDATLDRTARGPAADCTGPVSSKTLAQLRGCDFGSWFNETRPELARDEHRGLPIPTLDEVFARYGSRVRYYIETKNPEEAPGMEEALLTLLRRHRLVGAGGSPPRVVIQSFSPASLKKVRALEPSLPLVQLFSRLPSAELRDSLGAVRAYAAGIGPALASVDAELVRAAHAAGLVVHPYTVNDPADKQRLTTMGVDGFFTDLPER